MKKKLIAFYIFISCLSNVCYSQVHDIYRIEFSHSSSVVPSKITIVLHETQTGAIAEVQFPSRAFEINFTKQKYLELCESLLKINPKDIFGNPSCLDGYSTTIRFSKMFNSVEYSVICLNENNEKIAGKEFLNSVKLILEVSNLKFVDLF